MRRLAILAGVLCAVVVSTPGHAEGTPRADAWLPLSAFSPAHQALANAVTERTTLEREYPRRQFAGKAAQFGWLLDDLLACSTLAQQLGLIKYRVTIDDQGRAWADNQAGSRGHLTALYSVEGHRVYYVEGVRDGLFEARGRGVVAVVYQEPKPGTVEYAGAAFIRVDNPVLAALARMFRVFLTDTVDENYADVLRQPITICELAARDPVRLRTAIAALPAADRPRLAGFSELLENWNEHPARSVP